MYFARHYMKTNLGKTLFLYGNNYFLQIKIFSNQSKRSNIIDVFFTREKIIQRFTIARKDKLAINYKMVPNKNEILIREFKCS